MQVEMVSLITLLQVNSPLVESAVNVDDVAIDGALSLKTGFRSRGLQNISSYLSFSSDALL